MDRFHDVRLGPWGWSALLVLVVALGLLIYGRVMDDRLLRADPGDLARHPALLAHAHRSGRRVFEANCAACHGGAGKGDPARGVPDLTDADWLYGEGSIAEIEAITAHGIRAHAPHTLSLAEMPAYAHPRPSTTEPIPPLSPQDIRDMTEYVVALSGRPGDRAAAARAALVFQGRGGCYDCHGADGGGDSAIGAPRLTDAIYLYGGTRADIAWTLAEGRHGVSPAYSGRLSPLKIREAAIYVWSFSHRGGAG
jgi:cytochrome c oxidase cbb3-type subunit 3